MDALRDLEGKYIPTLAIALIALVPYILVTSASSLYEPQIGSDVGIGKTGLALAASFATAGYAFGALLCGDLINRFRNHRLFPALGLASAAGWAMAAAAQEPALYAIGTMLQGLATGMLLVVALPPTIQNFSWKRMSLTAAFINIGLFGAVAAGPLLGGAVAAIQSWRWLYGGFALAVAIASLLSIVVIPDAEPSNPGLRFDWHAMLLGIGATALPFGGVAMLASAGFAAPVVFIPLAAGIVCFVALLLVEYHHPDPLAPVEPMCNTLPVIGTLVATFGGGVFVTLMELIVELQRKVGGIDPLTTGTMFWPQFVAVLAAAVLLGVVFRTRYMPVLVLGGMIALIAGGVLLLIAGTPDRRDLLMVAVALLGLGAGTTVSPGLFLAGFSLESKILGRIVALVELIRSVGDFLITPVMRHLSVVFSAGTKVDPGGVATSVAISIAAAVLVTLLCTIIYAASGLRLPEPALRRWLEEDGVAIESPALFARLRG